MSGEIKKDIDIIERGNDIDRLLILEEAKKLKSVFLDNMSHELRTPITVILGYAGILYEEIQDPDLKEMAEIILKSSNRLTDSLNLLLDQSDIDSNRLQVELKDVNLAEIISKNYNVYKPVVEDKGLQFSYTPNVNEAYCRIDEKMFNKVLSNLLNNAVKFTEKGGINISLDQEERGEQNYFRVDVSDTGSGIPEDKQSLIFEAFRQVSEGMNRLHQGTGLGLSVSKKFIELMNGEMSVKSELNKGSTFSLTFPKLS